MKRGRGRPYSFKKLIQFSKGNIVLNLPASNIDAVLTGETLQFNAAIWHNGDVPHT
jgi:hypothetical protein